MSQHTPSPTSLHRMQSLTSDSRFFPQVTSSRNFSTTDWSDGIRVDPGNVVSAVKYILGANFPLKEPAVPQNWDTTRPQLFNALTAILPFESDLTLLRWQKLARPFASMIEAASFSLQVQCTFLVFFYARVLPFMSNDEAKSIMTIDGSPVEYSWVIPNRTKPVAGEPTKQVRFAIEPFNPRDGKLLRGASVLDYYNTQEGGLGVVHCDPQGMKWRRLTESFLFPDDDGSSDEIPEGSRFFVGTIPSLGFTSIVNVEGHIYGEQGEGWVTREVSKVFNHRPPTSKAGINTYITFGVKKGEWELASYFSPELLG